MAELPFFPMAIDAYWADTKHLTDAEHGRYHLILYELWRAPKQRLPNEDDWLARRFNRPVERVVAELRPLIAEFCQTDGNWITQKRLSKEFRRARKSVKQRSDAAKSRWNKGKRSSGRIYETDANTPSGRNAPTPTPTPTKEEERTPSQGGPGRARSLPGDWQPSEALLDRARKVRPDIQPARLKLETQGFISRKRTDNAHSHDWDETFIGWIIKTKIEEHRSNGAQRPGSTNSGVGSQSRNKAAFGAALNRLRDRGSDGGGDRDRRQEGDDARDVEATVLEPGQGPARDGEEGA